MSENKTATSTPKASDKRHVMYALSIHMKYGEVLHVEGLNKEEKDAYFKLARDKDATMIVEDKTSVRHLLSKDIAKVSVKAYDEKYEKVYHPLEKILFSESSMGRRVFTLIIKAFVILSILSIVGMFGVAMLEGDIMDVFFDSAVLSETILKGFDLMNKIFGLTVLVMAILNILDLGLGLRSHYYINQDGADPVEYSRVSNVLVTGAFIVIFLIAKTILNTIATML